MRRFDEGINYVHKVLKNKSKLKKELGEILNFRSYCYAGNDYCNIDGDIKTSELPPTNSPNPKFPLWIKSKKEGWKFEKFLNYFSHDINLIRYFFGEKFKIKAITKSGIATQDSNVNIPLTAEIAIQIIIARNKNPITPAIGLMPCLLFAIVLF